MWEHPVSLVVVYSGFYIAIVFLSLSIGELCTALSGVLRLPRLPDAKAACARRSRRGRGASGLQHVALPHCSAVDRRAANPPVAAHSACRSLRAVLPGRVM